MNVVGANNMKRYLLALVCLALMLGACSGDDSKEEATKGDVTDLLDIPIKKDNDNNPPVLHKVGNKEAQIGEELTIILEADDGDGDMLTYSVYGDMPPEAKFYKPEGRFVWTPTTAGGPFFVTFVVSDQKDFDSETVELRAVTAKTQHGPKFAPLGDQFLKVGELYELRLEATDEDGDMLYFKLEGTPPEGSTFDAQNALFRWTPAQANAGALVRVTFEVNDGSLSDQMEVRLIVEGGALNNHPPEVEAIGTVEAEVGVPMQFEVKATDPDDDKLTFAVEGNLSDGAQFNTETHIFSWTPPAAYQGKTAQIIFTVTDGTYTVKEAADILVKGKSAACADDNLEPNNKPEEAELITEGTFQGLSVCDTETSPIDEDWFKLMLNSGESINATIKFDHSQGDLDMLLYQDGDFKNPVFYSPTVGDTETVAYKAASAGTYFLRIAGTQSMKYSVPYLLEVTRTMDETCEADSKEPNNKLVEATSLVDMLDGTPIANLSICPLDLDVFSAPLQCGQSLIASIEFVHSAGDLDLFLLDQTGGEVLEQSATENSIETVVLDGAYEAATYYLAVAGYPEETTANSYSLEVLVDSAGDCAQDQFEPNDDAGKAFALTQTDSFANLSLCCDQDWFSFPQSDGVVMVELKYTGDGNFKAWLANSSNLNDQKQLSCTGKECSGLEDLPAQGTLYLAVEGTYGLSYSMDVEIDLEAGPADSCQNKCGDKVGDCYCDSGCHEFGDCCPDVCEACGFCVPGA